MYSNKIYSYSNQIIIYIIYLILQLLIRILFFNKETVNLGLKNVAGPTLFIGLLYALNKYKYNMISNILLGSVILLGTFQNISVLTR